MKQQHSIKVIAASLLTAASLQAFAGLGSLNVHSALGEPFSGSIVVTGEEAKILLKQKGSARVGGAPLRVSVSKQGNNAIVHLRSSSKINDPLLSFSLSVGQQGRQYTALLDPAEYRRAAPAPRVEGGKSKAEKRAAPERERKAHSRTEQQRHKKAAAPAKGGGEPVVFTGEQYTPQNGENLIDIAKKVQPQGLNLRQTMNALVKANPRAFRNANPDFMYRDVTLVIPTAEQMRQLAQPGADVRRIAQQSAGQGNTAASENKAPVTPPIASAPAAMPTESATLPVQEGAPVAAAPSQPETAMPAASVPEQSASAAVPVMVSEPESVPLDPPQTESQAPAPMQPEAPPAEGNFFSDLLGDNWYLYLGGGAALLLLLVGLMLSKRRGGGRAAAGGAATAPVLPTGDADAGDDDDIVFESSVPAPMPVTATAVTASAAAAAAVSQTTPVAPQEAQEETEWDWLADAAQQSQDHLGNTKLSAAGAATSAGVALAKQEAPVTAMDADKDWMSFETAETAPQPATSAPVAPVAETEEDEWVWIEDETAVDMVDSVQTTPVNEPVRAMAAEAPTAEAVDDWSALAKEADLPVTAVEPESAVAPAAEAADDLVWLEMSTTPEPSIEPEVPELAPAPAADVAEIGDDLAWLEEPVALEMPTADSAPTAEAVAEDEDEALLAWADEDAAVVDDAQAPPRAKGTEPTANAVQRQAFATSGQDLAVVDLDWEALDEPAEAVTEAPEIRISEDVFNFDDLSLEEAVADVQVAHAEVAAPDAAPSAPVAAEAPATPVLEADAAQLKVPMEAKLELAQMYLEIDDAQTARKTLQELVQEADGEVLAKARSLLQQLGE